MTKRGMPTIERFYAKTRRSETGCLLWTASVDNNGYGKFAIGNQQWERAHRWIWAHHNGPVPKGVVIRHDCDTPPCVELTHLVAGTQAQNIDDAKRRGRYVHPESKVTHCPDGHEYDEENTRITKSGSRACRACRRKGGRLYSYKPRT